MGISLCACNYEQGNESNVIYKLYFNFLIFQFSQNQNNNPQTQNLASSRTNFIQSLNSLSPIEKITLKNNVNKIISTYKKYKRKTQTLLSQYTNENITTEDGSPGSEYIGTRDSKGNKQGFGIHKMRDGSKFRGIFINNKVNGWGIYEHKDGDVYRGEYENDRTSGYGEYSHGNGAIYYGYWIDDMQFGIGYEIWSDSSKYSGEYSNGKKDGIGIYLWQDQTMYKGEWKCNNIQGYGIYNFIDGRKYSGEWKNNQMHGYGEFIWSEGKKYIGFYKNDKKDGFGIYYWPNNRFFVGFWKEGKQNGIGKYIKGDAVKYGIWKEGKREKWLDSEDDFANCLDANEEKFVHIFQWNKIQLKKFMEIGGNEDDEIENYKNFKSKISNKDENEDDDD